jgi:hypothetical protein
MREFPQFTPVNLWFSYPIHKVDTEDILKDVEAEGEKPQWKRAIDKRKPKETKRQKRLKSLEVAYEACTINGEVTISALEEYLDVAKNTVKNYIKEHEGFEYDNGICYKKSLSKNAKNDFDTDE